MKLIEQLQKEIIDLKKELEASIASREELLVSQLQLDALFDNSPVELTFKDVEGRYIKTNRRFESTYDTNSNSVVGLLARASKRNNSYIY